MVKKEGLLYLFIGQDSFSKDIKLKKIKADFLCPQTQDFNLDVLYAKELTLLSLQEKILYLPLKTKTRMIVIKEAQDLKADCQDFLLEYARKPRSQLILVLDINRHDPKDEFIRRMARYVQVCHFREPAHLDTFALIRQIDLKRADYALRILNQLLENGERPERILGGLRYSWEREAGSSAEIRRKLKLLLNCDVEVKTGRLKPDFALERLVIRLCCFG
jgi:DNA polymerase III delta subunit